MLKPVLTNISIADKSYLKGDMRKQYDAIVIMSDTIKTEELPKGTWLPLLLRYKVGMQEQWTDKVQRNVCDFLSSQFEGTLISGKKILVVSDGGNSRCVAAVVRLLINLGFDKAGALKLVKEKTGLTPAITITKNFPKLDEKRMPFIAKCIFGKTQALVAARTTIKKFGLTDAEIYKVPELTPEEIEREA